MTNHDDGTRTAGYGGVQTCGSVWACTVCSAKINAGRQTEIAAALQTWLSMGGKVAIATLTMRHRDGQRLSTLWEALSYAWGRVTSGRAWVDDQGLCAGIVIKGKKRVPIIRVVEVTHGANGWHVHVHALLLVGGHVQDDHVNALASSMFGRWSAALVRKGLKAPTRSHGVDLKILKGDPTAALSEYFTKAVYSASMEVTRSDLKDARLGNRTPFGILRDVVAGDSADADGVLTDDAYERLKRGTYTDQDRDLWAEWERASKGKRQITWSHGLRDLLTLGDEATDQDLADEDLDGDVVAVIDRDTWARIVFNEAQLRVLEAFEASTDQGYKTLATYGRGSKWRKVA